MRAFFTLFGEVGRAGWSGGPRGQEGPRQRGGMQTAARGEAGRRVATSKLRQGLGTPADRGAHAPGRHPGERRAGARRAHRPLAAAPQRAHAAEEAEALLDSIEQNPILRNAVVGFD